MQVTRTAALSVLVSILMLPGCSSKEDEEPSVGFSQIAYAVRQHTLVNGKDVSINVASGMGQVMDYKRYVPGGRIEILNLDTGDIDNVIASFPQADVASLDVSFDATKLLFSMKRDPNDNYNLYWSGLEKDAKGHFEIHQLTFTPYDELHAIWLAGDRIAFITEQPYTEMGTRADEYNHARIVTQVAVTTLDGGDADTKLCSQNLSHSINLFSLDNGQIGISRWEHLENVNDVKLFSMRPDCTRIVALSGQHGKPGNSIVQVHETTEPGVLVGIATSRENTIQAGALVRIHTGNEEAPDQYEVLTPSVPRGEEASPVGRYRSPSVLPDGRLLVSWAAGEVNDQNELSQTPPDYGVYLYQGDGPDELVVNHEDSWELYAHPVAARKEPKALSSSQNKSDASEPARIGSVDVRQTSLSSLHGETVSGAQFADTPMEQALAETVKVRIIEGFSSEGAPGRTMFGLTMAEGAALLGEAPVYADGSWLAEIPPYVPIHLQAVDEFDLAIRNQTTWIQGMPGEDRACGGCHEAREEPFDPTSQQLTTAAAEGPEDFLVPVLSRTEYPWLYANDAANPNELQKILSARCESCHNETTNGDREQEFYELTMTNDVTMESTTYPIPRMDLSARPITVPFDNMIEAWPASYVSIFYPAAIRMEVEMGDEVMGTIPPEWGVPSDARRSALIEKLNVTSERDPERYAWPLGAAFSNPDIHGASRTDHAAEVGMTRDEVVALIRAIDMGAQFYSRQNTAFVINDNDPTKGLAARATR